jgi:hypothetical protein
MASHAGEQWRRTPTREPFAERGMADPEKLGGTRDVTGLAAPT